MSWIDHQHRSKKLAAAAQSSLRRGHDASAQHLFAQAAEEAEQALAQVSPEKRVTLGAIAMLAASLWRRAHRSDDAARVARLIRLRDVHYKIDLNGWARYYFYFHKTMGYVLASFLIAGLSGLTR